jgi:S-adenosylmethionine decarboxylase
MADQKIARHSSTDAHIQGAPRADAYGQELILDLHGCDTRAFTRHNIDNFLEALCHHIDMERCDLHFWDDVGVPPDEQQTHPKTKGTSAVQFILTSTIVIHTLDLMEIVYINIFSCKDFDTDDAARFTADWFDSQDWTATVVTRR